MTCDNVSQAHYPIVCAEDSNAMRWYCVICNESGIIRKDINKGSPEKREYAKIFRRDILQGNDNLFYKYYQQYIKT